MSAFIRHLTAAELVGWAAVVVAVVFAVFLRWGALVDRARERRDRRRHRGHHRSLLARHTSRTTTGSHA